MEATQEQHQATSQDSQDTEPSPKLTINNLPNELLIDIFDFYRQEISRHHKWREEYLWFNLSRVCKMWRAIMFSSSSRLDVCLLLKPKNGTHMKTLMSTNPLIPIVIEYDTDSAVTAKDMGRLLSALKRPDRIRGIDLTVYPAELDKFFKATKCPFPALESLALRNKHEEELKIPATFLKGTNLHLRLRSLKLHPISLTSICRLLSSATALTDLSLKINSHRQVPDLLYLLSQLQGLPCLRHLDLEIVCFMDYLGQLTEPKESYPLQKLTSFHYHGNSALLDILTMGFEAPSLRDIDIYLHGLTQTLPPILHFPQFINDVVEHYRTVRVFLKGNYFDFSLLARSEGVGHHSPRFRLCSRFPYSNIQNWIMEITSMFSAKLSTMEELLIIFFYNEDAQEGVIPWRTFLEQFPGVKEFRIQGTNNHRIARALQHGGSNLSVLPTLERITFCTLSYVTDHSPELAVFQPFVSARQQAGRQVQVTCSPPMA
ncbi:hypothetical protein F5888DRAFT_1054241 [Russula emetica]|nr:hypothetical protein F5888DRAFT_1054241 [Russula emetica]